MKDALLSLKLPGGPTDGPGQVITPSPGIPSGGDIFSILSWVVNALTIVGVIAAIIFLILGGIKWITSSGDKEKLAGARSTILYSIIGLVVILLSVVIIQLIGGLLGVKIFGGISSNTTNSKNIDNNPRRPIEKDFDCPDKSENYACGKTSDTQCPLCSPRKDCSVSVYSIAECSSGESCTRNSDCPASNCRQGEKSASYCSSEGFCKSHCLPDDYQLRE